MEVTEIHPGLWRWTAPHPAWTEGKLWPREVGCIYAETPAAIVLVSHGELILRNGRAGPERALAG